MRQFVERWNAAGAAEMQKRENIAAARRLAGRIDTGLVSLRAARRTLGDRWMAAESMNDHATTSVLDGEIAFVKERIEQLEYWRMILEKEAATVHVAQVEKNIEAYLTTAPPPAEKKAA